MPHCDLCRTEIKGSEASARYRSRKRMDVLCPNCADAYRSAPEPAADARKMTKPVPEPGRGKVALK